MKKGLVYAMTGLAFLIYTSKPIDAVGQTVMQKGNSPIKHEKELQINIFSNSENLADQYAIGYGLFDPELFWNRVTQANIEVVQPRESLTSIAQKYGMKTPKEINRFLNDLYDLNPRIQFRKDNNKWENGKLVSGSDGIPDQLIAYEVLFINRKYKQQ